MNQYANAKHYSSFLSLSPTKKVNNVKKYAGQNTMTLMTNLFP